MLVESKLTLGESLKRIHQKTLLALLVVLTCSSICKPLAANQCNDTSGAFTFLVKWQGWVSAHEEDLVTINCSTSIPSATVSLLVDDEPINQSRKFSGSLKRIGNVFTFTAHLGQFLSFLKCHAVAQNQTIESCVGALYIQYGRRIEPVKLTPNITEATLEKGDDLQVTCQAQGYGTRDHSYISWYKQDATGKYKLGKSMVIRKSVPPDDIEVLVIKNATDEVRGTYICQRAVLGGPTTSAAFNIFYKEPEKPLLSISPSPLKAMEGIASFAIDCIAVAGSPKPSFGWYRGGVQRKACLKQKNCTLMLQKPTYPVDDGAYTCKAINSEGIDSRSVELQVLVAPVIINSATDDTGLAVIADANGNAKLNCTVKKANPLPTFTWFRLVGKKWTTDFEKVGVTPNVSWPTSKSTLVIRPSNDFSFYRCKASNEAGFDTRNITVHFKGLTRETYSGSTSQTPLAVVISCCSFIAIVSMLLFVYFYKRRFFKKYGLYLQPNLRFEVDSNISLQDQVDRMPYDPKWEFPRENLTLLEPIGKGAFGEVWLGKAKGILEFKAEATSMSPTKKKRFSRLFSHSSNYSNVTTSENADNTNVAVKTLKDNATDAELKDLASELKILIHIGEHQNIVNLLGACTQAGNLYVILEYCPYGDLSSFLREKRDLFEPSWTTKEDNSNCVCTYFDLANYTYEIARGMDFLASKKCVHRDLAARNILVSKDHNDAYVVKVADFGMSRDIYRDGIYVKQSSSVLPLKWTAPESIADAIYTSQSDVWSFGIVLWEIFTLGGSPYPGISTDEFLSYLKSRKRMDQPDSCPDEFYSIMLDCWEEDPDSRPLFSELYERIGNIIEEFADVDSAYLRLESIGSGKQRKESEYINASVAENDGFDSQETTETSLKSHTISCPSEGNDYENFPRSHSKKCRELKPGHPEEFVEMLSSRRGDLNDNQLHKEKLHPLL